RDFARMNVFDQGSHIRRLISDVYVYSRAQRQRTCFLLRGHDAFVNERGKAVTFADHKSLEAHFMTKNFCVPLLRAVLRDILYLRISRHNPQSPCLESRAPW